MWNAVRRVDVNHVVCIWRDLYSGMNGFSVLFHVYYFFDLGYRKPAMASRQANLVPLHFGNRHTLVSRRYVPQKQRKGLFRSPALRAPPRL